MLDGEKVQRQSLVIGRPIFGFPNIGSMSSGLVSINCSRYIGIVPFWVSTSCNLVGDHQPTRLYDITTQKQQSKLLMPQNIQILKKFPATWIYTHYPSPPSLVAWWSELLTTNHEVPGSIPGSTMCVFH